MNLLSRIRQRAMTGCTAEAGQSLRGSVNVYDATSGSVRELSLEECAAVAGGMDIWGPGGPVVGPAGH